MDDNGAPPDGVITIETSRSWKDGHWRGTFKSASVAIGPVYGESASDVMHRIERAANEMVFFGVL